MIVSFIWTVLYQKFHCTIAIHYRIINWSLLNAQNIYHRGYLGVSVMYFLEGKGYSLRV